MKRYIYRTPLRLRHVLVLEEARIVPPMEEDYPPCRE